jgi:hypothetical protein
MQSGWTRDEDGRQLDYTVAYFEGGRLGGVRSYATVGLSRHHLVHGPSGRGAHEELLLCAYPREGHTPYPQLLQTVANRLLETGSAMRRGDIFPFREYLAPGSQMSAFYAANPVYFDDAFFSVDLENATTAVMIWLVPVGRSEAELVMDRGWQEFEKLLIDRDPDVLDLGRGEIC